MLDKIKEIRKELTNIELEAGVKHPESPNYPLMLDAVAMIRLKLEGIMEQIRELM